MRSILNVGVVVIALAMLLSPGTARPCAANVWTVDTVDDDGGENTLRAALAFASDGDTINVTATGIMYLDPAFGPLLVDKSVVITGPGRDSLAIDGGYVPVVPMNGGAPSGVPVFWVGIDWAGPIPGVTASISGLTITHGAYEYGGGIMNGGTLTLTDCALTGNFAGMGGAVANFGTLTLTNCTLNGNTAAGLGAGAIMNGYLTGADVTLHMTGCEVTGNSAPNGSAGAIVNLGIGATAVATIDDCTIAGNSAGGGGAIVTEGVDQEDTSVSPALITPGFASMTITGSTISGNLAGTGAYSQAMGGAIVVVASVTNYGTPNDAVATLEIDKCTLNDNAAINMSPSGSAYGGALLIISDFGTPRVMIKNSTLAENSAQASNYAQAGAIHNGGPLFGGTVAIQNCTLAGNFATGLTDGAHGGAIVNNGDMRVDNTTLTGNYDNWAAVHPDMADLAVSGIQNLLFLTVRNTILANDPSGSNLTAIPDSFTSSAGYNLCTDDGAGVLTSEGDLINTDPMLGPLQDNGGPTWTCAITSASPAFNTGSLTDISGELVTKDQRGIARPQGAANDIGAFEVETPTNNAPTLTLPASPLTGVVGVAVAFTAQGSDPDVSDTLTYGLGSNAPAGASINPSTGAFSWIPTAGGTFKFDVTVTDSGNPTLSDTKSVVVNVSALDFSQASVTRNGRTFTLTVNLINRGSSTVNNVTLNAATLGGVATNSTLPLLYGAIKPGASKQCKLQFKSVPSGQQPLIINGGCTLGAFFANQNVPVP